MPYRNLNRVLLALIAVVSLYSCSTDFDLNAPYEEETVVYGLLNQNDSTHMLTIRKSFLGEGNAFDYALVADSSEYEASEVNAVIEEWVNGNMVRTWTLDQVDVENKEGGDFYQLGAKAYTFMAPDPNHPDVAYQQPLNTDAVYKLTINIDNGSEAREITAETPLVADFNLQAPFSILPEVSWASSSNTSQQIYSSTGIDFVAPEYARRFEVSVRLNYIELYGTDSIDRSMTWKVGTTVTSDQNGGEQIAKTIEGELIYAYIDQNLPDPAGLDRRILRPMDFIITVAGEDLHTYMEVNEPINGVVQERPVYTNINGGRGIFSSRYIKTVSKKFNKNSVRELAQGSYTGDQVWCSDEPAYGGATPESFFCGN